MNKNKIVMSIIIAIVCVILMTVMFAQFKTVEQTDITGIETAREEELQTMISSQKTKYEEMEEKLTETNKKILEYEEAINTNKETSEVLDKELEQTNMLVGKTNVIGEGIIVTLSDNEDRHIEPSDLRTLVNELKLAGAEAISINDRRIVNMTEIVEAGDRILINTKRTVSPYVVKAIGDQKYLSSALSLKTTGFVDTTIKNGKSIEMREDRNISILGYNDDKNLLQFKYAKEVEE